MMSLKLKALKLLVFIIAATTLLQSDLYAKTKKKVDATDAFLAQQLLDQQDRKDLKTELLVSKSEKQAIRQLSKLIRKYKGTPLEADMQMRLAELYVRRSKTVLFFELNKDSKNVLDFMPRQLKKKSSKNFVWKAIKVYNYIEKKFKNYENIDLVIFNNAMAYQQVGKAKAAEKKYWQMIKYHQYSPLIPDAHLAIGEINYKAQRYAKALDHFQAIKKHPQSRVYPYGLYKGAWALYNLRKAPLALAELEGVVKYGVYVAKNKVDARLDLRLEALADMTLFYGDVHKASEAYSYFKKQAGKLDASKYIIKLSRLYGSYSKFKSKEIILNDFINGERASEYLPTAYNDRVLNFEDMRNRPAAVKHLVKMDKFCFTSSWAEIKSENKEKTKKVQKCQKTLNRTALNLSSKWLRLWKKNPKYPVFANSAEGAFTVYLSHNTNSSAAIKARYVFADLLFKRAKFRRASEQYSLMAKYTVDKSKKGKYKPSKMAHDARYAAIVSLEKDVKDKWGSKDEKYLVGLVEDYVKYHPKGKYRLDIQFKVALIAYEKGRYEEASKTFHFLGEKYAKTEKGIKSQDLYLDILNIKKDYAGLKKYTSKLLKTIKKGARVVKLKKLYEQSYFLLVQKQQDDGKLDVAAKGYKKFALENKNSKLAEKAWWNAIQIHYKLSQFMLGADAAEKYYKMFPGAEHVKEALVKAAQSYEAMGKTAKAANTLDLLSRKDKKQAYKWKALSADFHLVAGHTAKAKKQYYQLLNSPAAQYHSQALKSLEVLASKVHMSKAHIEVLRIMIKRGQQPMASTAQLKFVEKAYKQKNYPKAFKQAGLVLKMGKSADTYAKARARIIQAYILEGEFNRQSLKSSIDRLSVVLNLKTGRLSKAQKAYEGAIRYGDPHVSVEAMTRLGGMYKSFFLSLQGMPLPRGLEEKDSPAFRQEIEKIAFPMEERSIETMVDALAMAKKYEVLNGSAEKIQNKIDEFNLVKPVPSLVTVEAAPRVYVVDKGGAL